MAAMKCRHRGHVAAVGVLLDALEHQATLWTQGADLKGHEGVKYKAKTA